MFTSFIFPRDFDFQSAIMNPFRRLSEIFDGRGQTEQ